MLGRLELDDVRAEVGQDLGARGAGPDPGEVADSDSVERQGRRAGIGGRNLSRPVVQPAFAVVRARLGSGRPECPPGVIELGARAGELLAVGVVGEEATGHELGVGFQLGHGGHRGHGHPGPLGSVVEVVDRLGGHPLGEVQVDEVGVLASAGPVGENFEESPLGVPHEADQRLPLGLLGADELHESVRTLVDAPRADRAGAEPRSVGIEERDHGRCELGDLGCRGEAREVDVLAAAGASGAVDRGEGHRRCLGGDHDGGVVAGCLERRQLGVGGRCRGQESPAGSMDEVELLRPIPRIGALQPERCHGEHHPGRVTRVGALRSVVDHQIRTRQEVAGIGHRPLVGVEPSVDLVGAATHQVGAVLDAHDVGTQVGEELGRPGDADASIELDDPKPCQASVARFGGSVRGHSRKAQPGRPAAQAS